MEYIATITIQRSSRGEGDVPVVMVSGSGLSHVSKPPVDSMRHALAEAIAVVQAGLRAMADNNA